MEEIRSQVSQEITLDARIHPRIIGTKGKNIRKMMEDFRVEIRLPRSGDPDPNLVLISGKRQEDVDDCVEHLRQMEEEMMEEVIERTRYEPPKRQEQKTPPKPQGMVIQGFPTPDDTNAFPSLGGPANGDAPAPAQNFGAWGRRH